MITRTAAATEVSDDHPRSEPEYVRNIVFVASKRCLEALSGDATRKVKRPAPSKFVEIRNKVVVEIGELLVVASYTLQSAAFGLLGAIFVFAVGRSDTGSLLYVLQRSESLTDIETSPDWLLASEIRASVTEGQCNV